MTSRLRLLAAFLVFTLALPIYADKASDIDAVAKKFNEFGRFNGSLLVADHGKVILSKGYGKANFEWDVPNTPDTKFRLGSITKQFTSMVVMQLVQEGRLKLDDPISAWLPDYRKDTGSKVTIRHLLTHTSGIPNYTAVPGFVASGSRNPVKVDEFIQKNCSGDLEFEPGAKWNYSNSGYFILGAIIEKATGKPYEENVTERIFKPLGMNDSGYDHDGPVIAHRAAGYVKAPAGVRNAPFIDMSVPYAAGSLYSTVEDLYKWDRALYTDKLLSPALKQLMFTPVLDDYAFGWSVKAMKLTDKVSPDTITHNGGVNGFSTTIVRFPKEQNLIVILDNTSQGGNIGKLTKTISEILYGLPHDAPKPSLAEAMLKTIHDQGAQKAVEQFRAVTASGTKDFDIDEGDINNVGYQLMADGKVDEAIAVFRLNVEAFPKSWNVYDSLGEAYALKGDKAAAIENYKKSVELDPTNDNGKEAIRKLEAPEAKVDPSTFESLTGTYDLAPTFAITITTEGGKLYGQATNQPRFALTPVSETEFRIDVVNASITFVKEAGGKASQLVLHQNGRDMPAKRRAEAAPAAN